MNDTLYAACLRLMEIFKVDFESTRGDWPDLPVVLDVKHDPAGPVLAMAIGANTLRMQLTTQLPGCRLTVPGIPLAGLWVQEGPSKWPRCFGVIMAQGAGAAMVIPRGSDPFPVKGKAKAQVCSPQAPPVALERLMKQFALRAFAELVGVKA